MTNPEDQASAQPSEPHIQASDTQAPPAPQGEAGGQPMQPSGPAVAARKAGRGRMVDLDPSGQVGQKVPDQQQRQFLSYAFYKLDPAFRRLPQAEREEIKAEFLAAVEGWTKDAPAPKGLIQRTYSLVGVRGDVDFMLWRIAFDPADFQDAQARLNRTRLMGYLTQPYTYLSMQKRSQYVVRIEGSGHGLEMLPGKGKYLFIYPFVKKREWYDLTPYARQGMMDEHIYASEPFKGVRINTSYSYGIDDQEFVVAFDSDYPQEFVDLVHRLRYTEASNYTLQDTPMFTCIRKDMPEIMGDLG
ncbi:Chlorite dismutase [Deinococcus proteolyticus MRP]|uniref:Chlorite dismutase n=1 Tax=Deinococcus proteolyticus (strain ATCC 35074 / DSM 20540 / JCM 6276 / NBRC 101906 / NCIMB 13154 / VKM Ac-1939 / CCM 2703 / MRP) TaxID=693977 RepID=F0RPA5_DEIPM|nr:Chlorite dismutase [Deinococcus proteolyticus MRP]